MRGARLANADVADNVDRVVRVEETAGIDDVGDDADAR